MIKQSLIVIMLFIGTFIYGQDETGGYVVVRDLETWSSANIKYKINQKWSTDAQLQLRLKDDSSEIDKYFGQLNLNYSFSKYFVLSGGLRYINKNDDPDYENHFRFNLDGFFKHKLNDFKFKYRIRYQSKNELDVADTATRYLRFKAGTSYNIKNWKLDPEVSGELFRSVGEESESQLERYRLTVGTSFKVHKSAKIALFYKYENELNQAYPKSTNIIGFKYIYTIK